MNSIEKMRHNERMNFDQDYYRRNMVRESKQIILQVDKTADNRIIVKYFVTGPNGNLIEYGNSAVSFETEFKALTYVLSGLECLHEN